MSEYRTWRLNIAPRIFEQYRRRVKTPFIQQKTPDSDPEIEDLLRGTPELQVRSPTPDRPLTPGAARITVEAANEPAVNMKAVVERL